MELRAEPRFPVSDHALTAPVRQIALGRRTPKYHRSAIMAPRQQYSHALADEPSPGQAPATSPNVEVWGISGELAPPSARLTF